ncbi:MULTISPECIES: DUF2511 domain-containing protein [Pseudomonas]|uniref:DUF2511 domain-containing protein n=1 Tax=Pseudomonas fluorescens TaxID=294 RepID=A0A0N9WST9_PSEFL|nr:MULTISPECIES: DUF2511 domain-containing protein [Pseudomonas]ALI05613.1 hypothetical protein AO356_02095 [Pseudomonas fluorescens]
MKRMTTSVMVLAMLASGVCGAQEKTQKVSSKDYGDAWPFTVDSVELLCFGPSPKALARTSDGTVYALSGSARSQAKDRGWSDGHDITKPNPTMPSIKMDYSDIVQRAQALCAGA